jgi:hypothetical protein
MSALETMTDEQFERHALEVLRRELGVDGLARFLRLDRSGSGDYTKDRTQWQSAPASGLISGHPGTSRVSCPGFPEEVLRRRAQGFRRRIRWPVLSFLTRFPSFKLYSLVQVRISDEIIEAAGG